LVAAGIAIALSLVLASPASALKLKYVETQEISNADAVTSVSASCPDGFQVVGGGAFSNGAFGQTRILSSYPADGEDDDGKADDAWTAKVWNTGLAGNMESQAICSKVKPKYRDESWTIGVSVPPRVKCPKGTNPTGGGIKTATTFASGADLVSTRPSDGTDENSRPEAWFANALAGMNTLTATTYVICVERDDFKPRYHSEGFTADNDEQDTGAEVCETGERLVGPGAATNSSGSALITVFGRDTDTDTDLKLDDGTTAVVDNYNDSDIFPEAYAVCAA
jgi:hypothetical protein